MVSRTFPRQQHGRFLCVADFAHSRENAIATGQADTVPFQLVAMGQSVTNFASDTYAKNEYRDCLEVRGIGVQLTEALAEY